MLDQFPFSLLKQLINGDGIMVKTPHLIQAGSEIVASVVARSV